MSIKQQLSFQPPSRYCRSIMHMSPSVFSSEGFHYLVITIPPSLPWFVELTPLLLLSFQLSASLPFGPTRWRTFLPRPRDGCRRIGLRSIARSLLPALNLSLRPASIYSYRDLQVVYSPLLHTSLPIASIRCSFPLYEQLDFDRSLSARSFLAFSFQPLSHVSLVQNSC